MQQSSAEEETMTAQVLDHTRDPSDGGGTSRWPVPGHEAERVAALHDLAVLDRPRQDDLDAVARLVAHVCGTPFATLNLIDADRQWQAAAAGTEPAECSRADALCAHMVTRTDVFWTPDARDVDHLADNPFVTGSRGSVRFYASAPLVTRDGHVIGTVSAYDEQEGSLTDDQVDLLRDAAALTMALFDRRRMATELARATNRDGLTGLANRRSVEHAIAAAIARAERGLGTPSVVVVDLDGFQDVNDAFGHAAGDAVLRAVADRLSRTARAVDTVGRLGGDEFVVLLESTGGPGAVAALNRLRRSLEDGWGEVTGGVARISASLGITTYRPGDSVAALIARSDAEMYADKALRTSRTN
jgi:diguanylate cyclase (GGDEF)-like protein